MNSTNDSSEKNDVIHSSGSNGFMHWFCVWPCTRFWSEPAKCYRNEKKYGLSFVLKMSMFAYFWFNNSILIVALRRNENGLKKDWISLC